MRYLILGLTFSLLGTVGWAQGSLQLEEPPQSFVFHFDGSPPLRRLEQELPRKFPEVGRVLLCERGGYLVVLPHQPLSPQASQRLRETLIAYLLSQGLHPYGKEGASVVELAQNCDQLLKPLLTR